MSHNRISRLHPPGRVYQAYLAQSQVWLRGTENLAGCHCCFSGPTGLSWKSATPGPRADAHLRQSVLPKAPARLAADEYVIPE